MSAGRRRMDELLAGSIEVGGARFVYLAVDADRDDGTLGIRELSAAELAVARLAVAGLSNAEIARVRGTSARTVANQLASIYAKVGVGSRVELIALLES